MKTLHKQDSPAVRVVKSTHTLSIRALTFCLSLGSIIAVTLFSACSATFRARGFERHHGYMERNDHDRGEHRK
jgi:hypothetical protein